MEPHKRRYNPYQHDPTYNRGPRLTEQGRERRQAVESQHRSGEAGEFRDGEDAPGTRETTSSDTNATAGSAYPDQGRDLASLFRVPATVYTRSDLLQSSDELDQYQGVRPIHHTNGSDGTQERPAEPSSSETLDDSEAILRPHAFAFEESSDEEVTLTSPNPPQRRILDYSDPSSEPDELPKNEPDTAEPPPIPPKSPERLLKETKKPPPVPIRSLYRPLSTLLPDSDRDLEERRERIGKLVGIAPLKWAKKKPATKENAQSELSKAEEPEEPETKDSVQPNTIEGKKFDQTPHDINFPMSDLYISEKASSFASSESNASRKRHLDRARRLLEGESVSDVSSSSFNFERFDRAIREAGNAQPGGGEYHITNEDRFNFICSQQEAEEIRLREREAAKKQGETEEFVKHLAMIREMELGMLDEYVPTTRAPSPVTLEPSPATPGSPTARLPRSSSLHWQHAPESIIPSVKSLPELPEKSEHGCLSQSSAPSYAFGQRNLHILARASFMPSTPIGPAPPAGVVGGREQLERKHRTMDSRAHGSMGPRHQSTGSEDITSRRRQYVREEMDNAGPASRSNVVSPVRSLTSAARALRTRYKHPVPFAPAPARSSSSKKEKKKKEEETEKDVIGSSGRLRAIRERLRRARRGPRVQTAVLEEEMEEEGEGEVRLTEDGRYRY